MFSKHVNQNYNTADVFGNVNNVNHKIPSGWLLRIGCCYEWTNQLFSATSRHGIFGRMAVPDGYYEWVAIPKGRINYFRPPVATPHYARGQLRMETQKSNESKSNEQKIKRTKIKRTTSEPQSSVPKPNEQSN